MEESEDTGKYQVNNKTVQGQVIGDHTTVNLHFHGTQNKAPSPSNLQRVWNIPYLRNDYFTGREEILAELHARFKANNATALSQRHAMSGLGGIGKTQVAVEYAYRYNKDYQAVLWARAESHEALTLSFVEIATHLDLPARDAQDQTLTVKAVKHWLQDNKGWLLILDNTDEPAIVHEFLPTNFDGHILLTTRAQALGDLAQRIEVDTFPPELGAHFLLRRATLIANDASIDQATPQDREAAMQISEEMGGLPLALDQAGAYIEQTRCGLLDYLNLYHIRRTDMLRQYGPLEDSDSRKPVVATTWSLSFQRAKEKYAATADLLYLCTFLAPDAIPEEIITSGAEHLGPLLQTVACDPLALNKAIAALGAYSLIRRDTEKMLSIHRLVQAVLKDAMTEYEKKQWAKRTVLAMSKICPDVEFKTWQQWEQYLPHALECVNLVEQENLMLPEVVHLLNNAGSYLCERARYDEAEKFYKRCLDIWQQNQERDTLGKSRSYRGLGNVYSEQGNYKEAKKQYNKSLHILDRRNLEHYPDLARCLNNLAILCKVQGDYKQAKELYQQSLPFWEKSLGLEHPDFAQSLNNLAVLHAELREYEKAKEFFKRCRNIQKKKLGPKHPKFAQSLSNLANVYTEQKKYEEAEKLYLESKNIFEQCKHKGRDHPNIAYPLNGLAILRQKQGKLGKAKELFNESRRIWEQNLGDNHPQIGYSFYNLAVLSEEQGNYEEAEQFFEHCLKIWTGKLGDKHLHIRICVKNYFDLLRFLKKDTKAQELKKRYLHYD